MESLTQMNADSADNKRKNICVHPFGFAQDGLRPSASKIRNPQSAMEKR